MPFDTAQLPAPLPAVANALAIDFRPNTRPKPWRFCVASLVAISLSIAADAAIGFVAKSRWPSLSTYSHFQPGDYVKLTVIGVIGASVAWPVVASISSRPKRLFAICAVVVTVVLLLPDLYIWIQGQPTNAVFALVCMHVAIALVTYGSLVLIAPVHDRRRRHRSRR